MKVNSLITIVGLTVLIAIACSLAFAQAQQQGDPGAKPGSSTKNAASGEQPQLPPGWTEADFQACAKAGTPGPQHEHLTQTVGVWHGTTTMWGAPGAQPQTSECLSTITAIMDGRFTTCEMSGEMPGMGPFSGFGLYGYDNVSQKYQSAWICNCGTGIMNGVGELSSDGTTLTWTYSYTCPITKKPSVLREVERRTGRDTITFESFGTDPKSGKEFKMVEIALTRKAGTGPAAAGPAKAH